MHRLWSVVQRATYVEIVNRKLMLRVTTWQECEWVSSPLLSSLWLICSVDKWMSRADHGVSVAQDRTVATPSGPAGLFKKIIVIILTASALPSPQAFSVDTCLRIVVTVWIKRRIFSTHIQRSHWCPAEPGAVSTLIDFWTFLLELHFDRFDIGYDNGSKMGIKV